MHVGNCLIAVLRDVIHQLILARSASSPASKARATWRAVVKCLTYRIFTYLTTMGSLQCLLHVLWIGTVVQGRPFISDSNAFEPVMQLAVLVPKQHQQVGRRIVMLYLVKMMNMLVCA